MAHPLRLPGLLQFLQKYLRVRDPLPRLIIFCVSFLFHHTSPVIHHTGKLTTPCKMRIPTITAFFLFNLVFYAMSRLFWSERTRYKCRGTESNVPRHTTMSQRLRKWCSENQTVRKRWKIFQKGHKWWLVCLAVIINFRCVSIVTFTGGFEKEAVNAQPNNASPIWKFVIMLSKTCYQKSEHPVAYASRQ